MDIAAWLRGLGLEQYAQLFRDNDIDGEILCGMTAEDLKELGIGSFGHRRRLLNAITALGGEPPTRFVAQSATGATSAPTSSPPIDAERRQLTVMFCDLVGSTALSAQLDPEDLREVIGAYHRAVGKIIAESDGFVSRYMGDGVLVYFGYPQAHEDDAERAVRAGLSAIDAVSRLDVKYVKLQTRVGIATGLVVVGDLIGEGSAQEQSVVGETPNLAARFQTLAAPDTVVIGAGTRRLVGDLFEFRDLGAVEVKGIAAPVPAWQVLRPSVVASRFEALRGAVLTRLVGRDEEIDLLLRRWARAKAGDGQVVLVSGEAGLGKSRIAAALEERLHAEPHFRLRYFCSPYHQDSALFPFIDQAGRAAGFARDDPPAVKLEKLEAMLARVAPPDEDVAFLADLLSLPASERHPLPNLSPQRKKERTLEALIRQLEGLLRQQPVVMVFEDAHWIDPTSRELLDLTVERVRSLPVLLIVTFRPEFQPPWTGHPQVTMLALNRLDRRDRTALVEQIAGGKALPDEVVAQIADRTDGVPLFVEELTKSVLESGLLREERDRYVLDRALSPFAIPTTLQDSLMARLDRLQPVREVAQIAAVIGRSFDHRTIAALAALPEDELAEAMRQLVNAKLIFRRGSPPDATYLFKHALVRDAAYESLLKAKRLTLHARLLDVLEDRSDAAPEVKAQHAEAAGLAERAIDYWEEAGTQALARPAYKEAIADLENAIRLCRARDDDLQWNRREQGLYLQLGQALIANQGYSAPANLRAFERALVLADAIGDVSLQLPALFGKWGSHYITGTGSGEFAQRYAVLAETQPETGPRLVGHRMLGLERFHEGRFKQSLALVRKALDSYDPIAHRNLAHRFGHDPRVAAASYVAWDLWHLGFPDQATRMIEDSLRWTREVDHANTTGMALCGATITNIWLRRPDWVESAAREALRLAEEMSLALWHAWGRIHLGWALSQQGATFGLDEIAAGRREARQIGAGRFEPFYFGIAADACSRAGRHDAARASIAEAFAALEQGRDLAFAAELHRTRALLLLRAGAAERAAAEADLSRALEIARQQEAPSLELRAARNLALVLTERGERQQAADLLAPVYGWFTEGFDTADLKEAKALLDQLA